MSKEGRESYRRDVARTKAERATGTGYFATRGGGSGGGTSTKKQKTTYYYNPKTGMTTTRVSHKLKKALSDLPLK